MRVHHTTLRDFKHCPEEFPDELMNEQQAMYNHGQSLSRLNERGGMSALEILCNIKKQDLPMRASTTKEHVDELIRLIREKDQPAKKTYSLTAKQLSDLWDAAIFSYENAGCPADDLIPDKATYLKTHFGIELTDIKG